MRAVLVGADRKAETLRFAAAAGGGAARGAFCSARCSAAPASLLEPCLPRFFATPRSRAWRDLRPHYGAAAGRRGAAEEASLLPGSAVLLRSALRQGPTAGERRLPPEPLPGGQDSSSRCVARRKPAPGLGRDPQVPAAAGRNGRAPPHTRARCHCCRLTLQVCTGFAKRLKPTDDAAQLPTDSVPGGDFKCVPPGRRLLCLLLACLAIAWTCSSPTPD